MNKNEVQGKPPIFKKWSHLYLAVMINLGMWLFVFYLFRKAFE